MGGVQLSPNIRKTSQRIDPNGNIIDPKTREILVPVEADYVPPVQVEKKENLEELDKKIDEALKPTSNPLKEAIKAEVQKAVQEQIKNIDIAGMVAEAMKEAFK